MTAPSLSAARAWVQAARERCEAAKDALGYVCAHGAKFTMSVPVRRDDFDIVVSEALNAGTAALAVVDAAAGLPDDWWLVSSADCIECKACGYWIEPDAMLPLDHAPDCQRNAIRDALAALDGTP